MGVHEDGLNQIQATSSLFSQCFTHLLNGLLAMWIIGCVKRRKGQSYPSGEYSRLNTAPWVWVLRLTDSTAEFIEQYKLVIVLKLSLAGSTNTPRLIGLPCSHENRLFPLRVSAFKSPPLPDRGAEPLSASPGDLMLCSVCPPLSPNGRGEQTRTMSPSTSESSISGSSSLSETVPLLGLPCDSSASSLSLRCSELIVDAPASTEPSGSQSTPLAANGCPDSGQRTNINTASISSCLTRHGARF